MRLTKIKLAGFKSFVDPTTLMFPGSLLAVVGPNGCGKSNIIDAVRWVMGESSAKTLRGESMADVIFNGSSARKPVGNASVELVFDNALGRLGGKYASYADIAIKRQVSRDGTSQYFLNGARCRRKDIIDIFLGTGLGARSYAIIEQGMVSRLIESKPEELRTFLEEAAGISKYRERRRETESRIRHTKDNLSRLTDLRDELGKQLERLRRQAKAAERYKTLKQEERRFKGELLALRWRSMDTESERRQAVIRELKGEHESAVAKIRGIEREIEDLRSTLADSQETLSATQGEFYDLGARAARIEQNITHARDNKLRSEQELEQAGKNLNDVLEHTRQDTKRLEELSRQLKAGEPEIAETKESQVASDAALNAAERSMQDFQERWDGNLQSHAEAMRVVQVERTRIEHQTRQLQQLEERLVKVNEEQSGLASGDQLTAIETLKSEHQALEQEEQRLHDTLHGQQAELADVKAKNMAFSADLDDAREQARELQGQIVSLESLQAAALGKTDEHVNTWLSARNLPDVTRLAEELEVDQGWERAVEIVLGDFLEAVCTDHAEALFKKVPELTEGTLTLFESAPGQVVKDKSGDMLASRVHCNRDLGDLMAGVRIAENLDEALRDRQSLKDHESVVTPDGIWLGRHWLRVHHVAQSEAGVLARGQSLRELNEALEGARDEIKRLDQALEQGEERHLAIEQQRLDTQEEINTQHRRVAQIEAELSVQQNTMEQIQYRTDRINADVQEIRHQVEHIQGELATAQASLLESQAAAQAASDERDQLKSERNHLQQALDNARQKAGQDREHAHEIAMRMESFRTVHEALSSSLERERRQLADLEKRSEGLHEQLSESEAPMTAQRAELEQLLGLRQATEGKLSQARAHSEGIEAQIREMEQNRVRAEQNAEVVRTRVEQSRLDWQEVNVRRTAIEEQLAEAELEPRSLLKTLPPEADEHSWQEKLASAERRIARLGPINLAAIDEYRDIKERKTYLDAQNEDITGALTTLENAIRKIDRETRTRFKDTFDKINDALKETFPRLFGGGHGYLELTGDDMLETGVTIMARPPGKRNSTIHLLSGGEKALTAVALLLSFFKLNPAPFCMLDEIDAPLDDHNLERFCQVIREMSEEIQFVIVTHNKITMEMVSQMIGVTMQEAGVSRLVAVDIDQAVRMAAN
ncbi:MAG: chromosome segregation protein SMC [Gammaproteobacteria bacterium]|nr:MAG: chromosome segregation protein SMC [Gammaproteobacteria bacterium]